jgi:hypothetical protein
MGIRGNTDMKRTNAAAVTALVAAATLVAALTVTVFLAGCGIGIGSTVELSIDEPSNDATSTAVAISMGAGKLDLRPGAAGLVSGVIRYNVDAWRPQVKRSDSSVSVKQNTSKSLSGIGTGVVNDWRLKLGGVPITLAVTAGAYEGTYELGGLIVEDLSIKDGAAKTHVSFSAPNATEMKSFVYNTGASTVELKGLADAKFKKMEFKGGAGSFTFDFSGDLRIDGSASISAGVGTVHIIVPADTAAEVILTGKLNDVDQEGTWTAADKTYRTPGVAAHPDAPLLTITVSMDLGRLTLTAE